MESEIILEEWSPVCNIQAFVEKTDKTYYFYLWINPESEEPEIRSCWICNRVEAPQEVDVTEFGNGQAPRMPVDYVAHDKKGIDLDEDLLEILWFEEGDAAALLSDNKILAVIPCFSGYNGFDGYSFFAEGTGPFAWEMKHAYKHFEEKVAFSKKFWNYFDTQYWSQVQESHLKTLENFFGTHEKYYAIDGGNFPPKALITGRKNGVIYGITAGVSMIPMPKVEMSYKDNYTEYRRMELGFACTEEREQLMKSMLKTISGLTNLPWRELTFLGHGHTIPISNIEGYQYILFLNANEMQQSAPKYDTFWSERINLLWLKLIKEEEYQRVCERGVAAYLDEFKEDSIYVMK